ncbi:DUF4262 domain-containing protein [Nonomuraea sp. NPDC050790]|uniref:DUF4262 domain-containing protein n=1 Tax=Nonomuraea sp. NPDC050790 TaxID=3364371 RepID=UPI0037B95361
MTLAISGHLADVAGGVARHGWIVQAIEGEGIRPYAHTVGLLGHGMPELLVTGLQSPAAAHLLNSIAPRWLAGEFRLGSTVAVVVGDAVRSADVLLHAGGLAAVASALYGKEHTMVAELVWTRER